MSYIEICCVTFRPKTGSLAAKHMSDGVIEAVRKLTDDRVVRISEGSGILDGRRMARYLGLRMEIDRDSDIFTEIEALMAMIREVGSNEHSPGMLFHAKCSIYEARIYAGELEDSEENKAKHYLETSLPR